jgi:hypothetical protein
VGKRKDVR